MEDGLRESIMAFLDQFQDVLILVVMEDGLRGQSKMVQRKEADIRS